VIVCRCTAVDQISRLSPHGMRQALAKYRERHLQRMEETEARLSIARYTSSWNKAQEHIL